jgi:hypothetical protein
MCTFKAKIKKEPSGNDPKCKTCGDLSNWGTHPACERNKNGSLKVWKKNEAKSL